MPSVVFTGKGIDPLTNKLRTRPEWEALAAAKGFYAQKKVDGSTDYLVASRSDTTKADSARRFGTKVITYQDFERMLRGQAPVTTHNSRRAFVPPKPVDTTGMENIPGWGMF
jgi:hypothetical protein